VFGNLWDIMGFFMMSQQILFIIEIAQPRIRVSQNVNI